MFIIDFDDTLFDTHAFKEALRKALNKLGVSDKVFWQTYKEARNEKNGLFTYSPAKHAEILERHGFNKKKTFAALSDTAKQAKKWIAPDAACFLSEIKKMNVKMILLSLGDANFQKAKLSATGITIFFDEIYAVDDTKKYAMEKIVRENPAEESVWLINDKVAEVKEIMAVFPKIKSVLRVSPMFPIREYQASGLPHFRTLTEILNYVQTEFK